MLFLPTLDPIAAQYGTAFNLVLLIYQIKENDLIKVFFFFLKGSWKLRIE